MQESWGSYSDRVSRLGWEAASERPMAWRAPWRHLDPILIAAALGLVALGCAAVYSSTVAELRSQGLPGDALLRRQLLNLLVAVAGMLTVTTFDYRRLQSLAGFAYGGMVLVLGLVLPPLGSSSNGAQSWFDIASFQFQPSELAKVVVIVGLAAVLGQGDGFTLRQLG